MDDVNETRRCPDMTVSRFRGQKSKPISQTGENTFNNPKKVGVEKMSSKYPFFHEQWGNAAESGILALTATFLWDDSVIPTGITKKSYFDV